jgi:hypothetical protein
MRGAISDRMFYRDKDVKKPAIPYSDVDKEVDKMSEQLSNLDKEISDLNGSTDIEE